MNFFINSYPGQHSLAHAFVFFTRERADQMAEPTRVGVWRIRPRRQKAFQDLHLWACWSEEVWDRHEKRTGVRLQGEVDVQSR